MVRSRQVTRYESIYAGGLRARAWENVTEAENFCGLSWRITTCDVAPVGLDRAIGLKHPLSYVLAPRRHGSD